MTCPKCGAARPEEALECPQCGIIYARFEQRAAAARAAMMTTCPACGKEVSKQAPTCPGCGQPIAGAPLQSGQAAAPPPTAHPGSPEGRKTHPVAIGCGIFILLGVLLSMFSGGGNKSDGSRSPVGARTIKKDAMGCRDIEDLKRLIDMAVARDQDAFSRAMVNYTAAGRCRLFRGGETAYTEETKLSQGAIRVRVAGEVDSWWISL